MILPVRYMSENTDQHSRQKNSFSWKNGSSYRVILLYKSQIPTIIGTILLLILGVFVGILKPWPVAFLLDNILGKTPFPDWIQHIFPNINSSSSIALITYAAISILLLHLLSSTITSVQNYLVIRIGLKGLRKIRESVFVWIQRLSLGFFTRHKQGDIMYRVCWDTYSFQTLFQHVWFSSLSSILTMLSMLWVMWYVNEMLTLISCITLPLMVLAIRIQGKQMNQRSMEAHQSDSQVAAFIQESISSIPVIQSFVLQKKFEAKFSKFNFDAWKKRLMQHAAEISYQSTVALIFSLGMAGIAWGGAREVLAGRLSAGELVVFITYLSQFYEPLQKLAAAGTTLADARAGVKRVYEVLDAQPEIRESEKDIKVSDIANGLSVEFQDVSFGYLPESPIIKDINFTIKKGEFVALIGPSGVGKSTLSSLIPRFYDVPSGCIKINGINIKDYNLDSLRSHITLVQQNPFVFSGTVRDNLLFGKESATDEEIQRVLKLVHAEEFINKLPQKLDTLLGEGGQYLSVGETQRICIARAFLKNAPLLILDEPTSSLDAENQKIIIESLKKLTEGKTTLMIAHRMATLANASKVIVLNNGKIEAIGTHQELLEKSDYYKRALEASVM